MQQIEEKFEAKKRKFVEAGQSFQAELKKVKVRQVFNSDLIARRDCQINVESLLVATPPYERKVFGFIRLLTRVNDLTHCCSQYDLSYILT